MCTGDRCRERLFARQRRYASGQRVRVIFPRQVRRPPPEPTGAVAGGFRGFDSNDYPGDATMATLHKTFAFTGYWLTNPPGENSNTWTGKRAVLRQQGWGFLALANGRLDDEILKAQKTGTSPAELARKDAAVADRRCAQRGLPASRNPLPRPGGGWDSARRAGRLPARVDRGRRCQRLSPRRLRQRPASPQRPRPDHHHHRRHPRARRSKITCIPSRCSTRRMPARPRPAAPSMRSRSPPPA